MQAKVSLPRPEFCYHCAEMIEEIALSGESTYKNVCK